ncbi:hypothetical protein B0H17DRAFT_1219971 [Mycena rosella]|uniref:Uncharacterized protein n=1 Tax=Mycena rosella TaxID=1033263 RepID=A0AAD7BE73_MYCRO|nr:hypothetical protein B0H17DRAFT_1219971 [Mycena rosella]
MSAHEESSNLDANDPLNQPDALWRWELSDELAACLDDEERDISNQFLACREKLSGAVFRVLLQRLQRYNPSHTRISSFRPGHIFVQLLCSVQSSLNTPNLAEPAQSDAYVSMRDDPKEYEKKIKLQAKDWSPSLEPVFSVDRDVGSEN